MVLLNIKNNKVRLYKELYRIHKKNYLELKNKK